MLLLLVLHPLFIIIINIYIYIYTLSFSFFSPESMGNGSSSSKTTSLMMGSMATVKLILLNGELQEFCAPIKVGNLVDISKDSFICNSEDMEFEGIVKAINGDEELQVGQLYFELPLCRLTQPLQPEEMASLAVKANAGLQRKIRHNMNEIQYSSGCCFGSIYKSKRVDPSGFVFYNTSTIYEDDNSKVNKTTQYEEKDTVMLVKSKRGMVRKYISSRFSGKLSIISEEDE